MTRKRVTDEQYGRLSRRTEELKRRVQEGTLSYEGVMEILQNVIEGLFIASPLFKVTVDYTQTLKQMISAGKYDWASNDITTEHFPIQGKSQQEKDIIIFHFNRTITSDDAIAEMDKAGFRPATIEELLALGAAQPELQEQFPIVAFGSVWRHSDGNRSVSYLLWNGNSAERGLGLGCFESDWGGHCHFAAVRK